MSPPGRSVGQASLLARLAALTVGLQAGCGVLADLSGFEDVEAAGATTSSTGTTSVAVASSSATSTSAGGGGGGGGADAGAGGTGGGQGGGGGASCEGVECAVGGACRDGECRGELRWTLLAGDIDTDEEDQGIETMAFHDEELVVAGVFHGSIALGDGLLGQNNAEVFVGRIGGDGGVVDEAGFSADYDQRCGELYVGSAGIVLAGYYNGNISFPPEEDTSAAFSGRGYVARFGSDLTGVALGTFGSGGATDTKLLHMRGDASGTFAAGSFAPNVDTGACGTFTSTGQRDALFMAVDHEGECTSATTIGGDRDEEGVASLPAGDDRYLVVSCGGPCDLQGMPLTALQTPTVCIVRTDDAFTPESATSLCLDDFNLSTAFDAVIGDDATVFVAGAALQALRAAPLVARVSFETPDEPSLVWATILGNGDDTEDDGHAAVRLARHTDGRLRVAVTFTGPLEIDDLDLVLVADGIDAAILEIDGETGRVLSARQIGGDGDVLPSALVIGHEERVCLGGAFSGTIDLGNGPRISDFGYDAFVACYDD